MSGQTPFEVIAQYCQQQQKNTCVRDLAYSIYRQQFESLTSAGVTDQTTITATQNTLLSPGSLVAHVRTAEESLKAQIEIDLKHIRTHETRSSFWAAVATGIVGNIIYSLLLIILFIVAKDQLGSWLASLAVTQP